MRVIELEVDDTLVQEVGAETVKAFMVRQLSLLRLRCLGDKIAAGIHESGMDHRSEVQEARGEAWQEYKERHLKGRL